jgi:hypothetical protein
MQQRKAKSLDSDLTSSAIVKLFAGMTSERKARENVIPQDPSLEGKGLKHSAIHQGLRANSGFSRVTGIKSFFETPSHNKIGFAKKIDDSVPITIPMIIVSANP